MKRLIISSMMLFLVYSLIATPIKRKETTPKKSKVENYVELRSASHSSQIKKVMSIKNTFEDGCEKIVVVYVASWCGPCIMLRPYIDNMNEDYSGEDLAFYYIDVDKCTDENMDVAALPTTKFYKYREEQAKVVGANIEKIKNMILRYK